MHTFKCKVCAKTFSRKAHLQRHLKIHQSEGTLSESANLDDYIKQEINLSDNETSALDYIETVTCEVKEEILDHDDIKQENDNHETDLVKQETDN